MIILSATFTMSSSGKTGVNLGVGSKGIGLGAYYYESNTILRDKTNLFK